MAVDNDTGPCFYCSDLPEVGEKAHLEETETHHAGASRRTRVGDSIGLIDGKGVLAVGVVETVARDRITVTVRERTLAKPRALSIVVASAVPKGDRFRTMIDMISQIGVSAIVPLICDRSTVKPRDSSLERWQRIAIEACKQSRNPYVPKILTPRNVPATLAAIGRTDRLAFADVHGVALDRIRPSKGTLHLYVGPEGGFTETEKNLFRERGGMPVNLGGNVLRVETAAIVGAALSVFSAAR